MSVLRFCEGKANILADVLSMTAEHAQLSVFSVERYLVTFISMRFFTKN